MEKITRKDQKNKTYLNLVNQAEFLFAKHGIANTTTAEIAKSINISHGALFVHFKTREELILSVVEKFGDRLASELGRRFMDDMKLKDLLQAHLEVLSEFEDFYLRLIVNKYHNLTLIFLQRIYFANRLNQL